MIGKLSNLPLNWKNVKLMDVATLVNGRAYKKNELLDVGPVPVLRVGNFFSNRSWYYSDLTLPEDKYCEVGDLLFAWSASFGPKIWDGPKAIYHYHIWKILTSPAIDKHYLYYLLDSISADIKSQGNGIAMIHATKGGMEQRVIPLPPLAEQQKIAAILDAADQLRQKDQQLIDHYTALSQSLFLEMFGDPVRNPKGWDVKSLKNMGRTATGNTPSRAISSHFGSHIEWIKTNNINTPHMYLTKAEEFLSESGLVVGRTVDANSLLVTCIAGSKRVIGNVAVADRKVAFNQQINAFTPKEGNLVFFYNMFLVGQTYVQSFCTDGMKGMISKSKFESIEFIFPPVVMQEKFGRSFLLIEKQKQQAQKNLKNSTTLFNSLLQRAFKGELTSSKAA